MPNQPVNHGYYGKLEFASRPDYITPVFDSTWGLFKMADHLRALARNMNATSYQLRRNVAGHDRAQGCVMMIGDR